ncbi:hypothetical protein [Litoreibacter roseus]|uniref:Uncharacterized protein n=1 Tax=Litoreibacter roseus TaxID=2601869 RepID=A0A6N6JMA0_9RHOB|nr:hypothetical protein [Litoreibacter roseus]GFE67000.1 hypothetical protein KIN_40740 [Litoreibacter roseus]
MKIVAYLSGPFRLETDSGDDLTPMSAKVCGLVLLLLTSPNGSRERAWLQDKLWSDRGQDQSAGSLRQAVFQFKKALGIHSELLKSTKRRVSLDLSEVSISEDCSGEFAEGIDVRDVEFESWLTVERSNRSELNKTDRPPRKLDYKLAAVPPTVTLAIETAAAPNALAGWFTEVIADHCSTLLNQVIGANVIAPNAIAQSEPAFQLTLSAIQGENEWIFLRARLSEAPLNIQIWSGHRVIKSLQISPEQDDDVLQMIFEICETIREKYSRRPILSSNDPPLLNAQAITNMFTMTEQGAGAADLLLINAHDSAPHATHLAWRAQIRVIQYFEKYRGKDVSLLEESRTLSTQALEKEPNNSTVLALAANTMNYLEGRLEDALALATRAVELNSGNPFAWWTLAAAQLSNDDLRLAYESSLKSRHLLRGSTLEFLPESILGGAALAMGKEAEALHHFERSLSFRPSFKPSLRYALGLNVKQGNVARARALAKDLGNQETGFKPDQLMEDGKYPTSLFRRDNNIDFRALRDLIE